MKQANIAHGPQWVKNVMPTEGNASRAENPENLPNKLLEAQDGERLDFGTAPAAVDGDKGMATLGEVDRTKNKKR